MIYCPHVKLERDCMGICKECPYGYCFYPDTCSFNYECPDCHGKFNQPSVPTVTSSLYYRCPFCGRHMPGIKL